MVTQLQSVAPSAETGEALPSPANERNLKRESGRSVGAYGGTPTVLDDGVQVATNLPTTRAYNRTPLQNAEVLWLWEAGQTQGPIERALTILAAAYLGENPDELALLPIGVRDSRLLAVREATFGSALNCLSTCPACGETTELTLHTAELQSAMTPQANVSDLQWFSFDGWEIEFRLPNSRDLADAVETADSETSQLHLIERCILRATENGKPANPTATILDHVYAEMAKLDPGAEFDLSLTCPSCGTEWQVPFDIASFLWIEIDVLAKRLLREVAALARAYGWREADVLALSAVRRQAYLDLM